MTHPPQEQVLQGWAAGTVGPSAHTGLRRAREGNCEQPESRLPNKNFLSVPRPLATRQQNSQVLEFRALLPAILQAYVEAARLSVDWDG